MTVWNCATLTVRIMRRPLLLPPCVEDEKFVGQTSRWGKREEEPFMDPQEEDGSDWRKFSSLISHPYHLPSSPSQEHV